MFIVSRIHFLHVSNNVTLMQVRFWGPPVGEFQKNKFPKKETVVAESTKLVLKACTESEKQNVIVWGTFSSEMHPLAAPQSGLGSESRYC